MPNRSENIAQLKFISKCKKNVSRAGSSQVVVYSIVDARAVVDELAPVVKSHYLSENRIIKILIKWGRKGLAKYISHALPESTKGRSGHLGEILATEYINCSGWGYEVPIKRLRWKDDRDCAMRGEDVLGFIFKKTPMKFLKGESKSRMSLSGAVVDEARKGLEKNSGLPQAHTLMFISERLREINQDGKAEQIEEYVVGKLPDKTQVAHLIFVLSGNDPFTILDADVRSVKHGVEHFSVGFFIKEHQKLIKEVFEKAPHV